MILMTRSYTLHNPNANAGALSGSVPQAASEPQAPQQQARTQPEVDDSRTLACYANFCRVTGTPEELIIDFGLNPQPVGAPTQPIVAKQRIVANWYTAKRLLQVLQLTVGRHEATFGALETDVQKRVRRA
jgi:hypothetical protein